MKTMLARHLAILWSFAMMATPVVLTLAGIKATATRSLTVQPAGPRQGEAEGRYFNVEGVKKERYASVDLLALELPKAGDRRATSRR